jgi:hypothetical protein
MTKVRNVHTLVAEAFLGPRRRGYLVVNLDEDLTNNSLANLAYRARSEWAEKPRVEGKGFKPRKLTASEAREIRRRACEGEQTNLLARAYGISAALVSNIKYNRQWRDED